jgi:hypothetical protein
MTYAVGFFILGTVLWVNDKSYNPLFDYGIGLVLAGLAGRFPPDDSNN